MPNLVNQTTPAAPQTTTTAPQTTTTGATPAAANSAVAERAALARGLPPGFRRLTAPFFAGGDPPAEPAFEADVYRVVADLNEEVAPLVEALRAAEADGLARAAARADAIYRIDVPLASRMKDSVLDLAAGGDLAFDTAEIVQSFARLSRHAKKWLRESPRAKPFMTARLTAYVSDSSIGSHAVARADLTLEQRVQLGVIQPLIERRIRGARALLALIETGRFPRTPTTDAAAPTGPTPEGDSESSPEDASQITAAADALVTQIERALGPAPAGGGNLRQQRAARATESSLSPQVYRDLLATIESADPAVRDLVYANATLMDRLQSSASVTQVAGLMRSLDSVEGIFDECMRSRNGGGAARQGETPAKTPFELIATYLRGRPGPDNRGARDRILAHTRLKDDFIDLLPEADNRAVYRLVVRGTDEPTPVDRIHEAARTGNGRMAAEALLELASSDPEALAGLEADQIFRTSISRLSEEVDVGGALIRPYHLCLNLWGRTVGQSTDPGDLGGPVVDNPTDDRRPLNVEERNELRTQLYEPSARTLRNELDDFWGVNNGVISRALRAFAAKSAEDRHKTLIRRHGVPPGQELAQTYQRVYGRNLRTDIRNGVDDEGRREADRILDISIDSASLGTIEGQAARAGDGQGQGARQIVSLDQALGEVLEGSQTVSVALHKIVTDLHDELSEWAINGGAELSDFESIVKRVPRLWDKVGAELRVATGLANLHWAELLSNAYAEVGGSLAAEIASEWDGADRAKALRLAGIHPSQVQERAAAAQVARDPEAELRQSAESRYRGPAQALFSKLSSLTSRSVDGDLEETRRMQADFRLLARIERGLPAGGNAAPLRPMPADQDISSAAGYYRAQFGIDLGEHARRVARGLVPTRPRQGDRDAAQIARLLGVDEAAIAAPIAAPADDELLIDERNRTMVRPGFTTGVAEGNAREMWRILHGRGEVHLINAVLYGPYTDEEQRLIRIAFRRLSGGIDYQFYLRQALELRTVQPGSVSRTRMDGAGTAEGDAALEGLRVQPGMQPGQILLDVDETELATALDVATTGEIDNTSRLRAAAGNGDVDQIFRIVEELDDAGCRQVMGDGELMRSLEQATGGVAWDRVYRILTGQASLADRLVSRSEGADGFWQFLDATDEAGMRDDIKSYIRMLRGRIETAVRAEVPDPRLAGPEINRRVRAACLELLANADVGAIIEDELSGFERSQADGIFYGGGEESRVANVLRDGDWTDPEDDIIASIRQMPPEERARLRNDPEYIRRLGRLCDTEEQFRDAMNALGNEGAAGGTDHLAALDDASRGPHEIAGDMNRDEGAILDNLTELSEDEYRRLLANPRLRAQILAALDNDPEERELARRLLAFRFEDAGAELGVDIAAENTSPADGALARAEAEELAFLKFNAIARIRRITEDGRSWDRMLKAAVEVFKLGFEGSGGGAGAATVALTAESAPGTVTEETSANPRLEHAARARRGVWQEVNAQVQNWAHGELSGTASERTAKISTIRDAVLKVRDPSTERLRENVGVWDEDDDIVEALANASNEVLVNEWSSVKSTPALGGPSMRDVFGDYRQAKEDVESRARSQIDPDAAASIDAEPETSLVSSESGELASGQVDRDAAMSSLQGAGPNARPMPPVGSDLSAKQLAFMNYVIDISDGFEDLLFAHAGGWMHGDSGENTTTTRRDNKQWHEWADAIRDRIPGLPANLIGQALGIDPSDPDFALIDNPNRAALTRANHRLSRYLRQRGSQTQNTRFASDEAENLDVAMTRYGRAVGEAQIGETPEGYGVISETEGLSIEEDYGREVDRATSDFKAAKAAIAQWAAIIVGVLVTAIITILTAGVATGPAAAIMMSAVTAAMSATASAATQEAIMGGDYDFSGEGLESVATAAVTGIITAGATYYAQVITRNLAGIGGDAAKMAQMMRTAQPPGWQAIATEVGEELISESITGLAEAGLEYLDPTIWLEGWDEGVRRGNAAAGDRLAQMPRMYLQAALTSMVLSGAHRVLPRTDNPLDDRIEETLTGRVDVRKNFQTFFGDQSMVMLEAFTSYAIQAGLDGDIDLENVPGDLVRAYLDEIKEQALDMHIGTAHAGVLRRRVQADLDTHRDQLTEEEVADYMALNQVTLDEQSLAFGGDEEGARLRISVADYIRLRETAALAAAQAFSERTGQELSPEQLAAFVAFVRRSRDSNEFRERLATNPLLESTETTDETTTDETTTDETTTDESTDVETIADETLAAIETTEELETDVSEEEVDASLTGDDVTTETTPETTTETAFSEDQFPVPDLVLGPDKSREALAQFGRDQAVEAARLHAEMEAKLEAGMDPGQAIAELYAAFSTWRVKWQLDNGFAADKFRANITDGDSNYDPFGVMPGLANADGTATPAMRERAIIGELMAARFEEADQAAGERTGDTLQTMITLPDGRVVAGNVLHRGESAQAIYDKKGQKYDYENGDAEMFISETGTEADRAALQAAGTALLGQLVARAGQMGRAEALSQFASAAFFLFHGPQANRGSDSVIRGVLTVAGQEIFGTAITLPQDIDVRAYGFSQAQFEAWLAGALAARLRGQAGSSDVSTDAALLPLSPGEQASLASVDAKVAALAIENSAEGEAAKVARADAERELATLIATLGLETMSEAERERRLAQLSPRAQNFVLVRIDSQRRETFRTEAGEHGRLEVHNHFMGVAGPDVFAARVGMHEAGKPENAGKSSWELTLDAIASLASTPGMAHAVDDEGRTQRGISGDALILVAAAQKEIAALRADAAETDTVVDGEKLALIAEAAVRKALIATQETDFNSSYEVRDELIKKYFGKTTNEEGELTPDFELVTDEEREASRTGAERAGKSPEAAEAGLTAYADYAKEAIAVLVDEGQSYTEQSQSLNKLLRSFPRPMLQRLVDEAVAPKLAEIEAALASGSITAEEAERRRDAVRLVFRNLAMIPTGLFAPTDAAGKAAFSERAGKRDVRPELSAEEKAELESEDAALRAEMESGESGVSEPDALRAHGDEFIAQQEKFGLFEQLERGDTTGIDIAGLEEFKFNAAGRARFRALYRKLAAVATVKGDVVVLRPHVGEGSLDLSDTSKPFGIENADRQAERAGGEGDGPTAAELAHYDRARHNVDALIASLEELAAMGELDPSKVEVRFGHSTHATPEQIIRLRALGVIAEINLESNIQTFALDPTNPESGKVEEGRFEDHALLTLLYYQVDMILSTDAHSVMSTDLAKEYAKAFTLIEAFLHGQLPLRLRPEDAGGRGRERVIGAGTGTQETVMELLVGDLNRAELDRFLGAYQTIMSYAESYRDQAIARETGGDEPGDGGPLSQSDELTSIQTIISERYSTELTDEPLVGPDPSAPVLTSGPGDALIGLPTEVISPEGDFEAATEALEEGGIPRYPLLTAEERRHEEAFIAEVAADIPAALEQIYLMSYVADQDTYIFEVDAAKRLYSEYGAAGKAGSEAETKVRLTANHAMHPTAVAVTRLAFLKRLDELAGLAEGDPKKSVFVTNGGCAAGKGSLTGLVADSTGSFDFGAVWDAAGEGDAQENGWILAAAAARGLKVTFGFVENDPIKQYQSVLHRAEGKGRVVDPVTFARSYVNGQRNFRAFLDSPEFRAAQAAGTASAFGMFTGAFNVKSMTDESESPYPDARLLGEDGKIDSSDDLAEPADVIEAINAALALFDEWRAAKTAEGKNVDDYFIGAIVNALKFGGGGGSQAGS